MLTLRRVFAIALCLVTSACGPSAASPKPDKVLSDDEFVAKLGAAQDKVVSDKEQLAVAEESRLAAAPPKVTTATFEPLYRATKMVQGATASGVTYVKLGELMQAFATELDIAKDHELNYSDTKLLAVYREAYDAYQFSLSIWKYKIQYPAIVAAQGIEVSRLGEQEVQHYGLQVRTVDSTARQRVVIGDPLQQVWAQANVLVEEASAVYLGKSAPTQ